MSGPWDRPSQDREPSASDEDAAPEHPEAGQPPGDAWPSSDLWSDQRPEAASGWDDWSTLRAPDDFVLDEPVSTLGDPWAESWAEETAGREAPSRPVEEERWAPGPPDQPEAPEPDRWSPPADEPEQWAASAPPEESWTAAPAADEVLEPSSVSEPATEAAPSPMAEPEAPAWQPEPASDPWIAAAPADPAAAQEPETAAARVAPWQSSDDPWSAVVAPEEPVAAEAPVVEEGLEETTAVDEAEPVASEDVGAEAGPAEETPATGGWRRDLLPAWLIGRSASGEPEPVADDVTEGAGVAEWAAGDGDSEAGEVAPAESDTAPVAAESVEPAVEPADALAAAVAGAYDTEPAVAEPEPEPLVEAEPEPEPTVAEPEPIVSEPEPEPFIAEAEPEPEPTVAEPEPAPSAAELIAPIIAAVAWEDDAPSSRADAEPVEAADAVVPAANLDREMEADAEAAAELETPATTVTDAWPESDVAVEATAPPAPDDLGTDTDPAEAERDPRFDAFLGASALGAAAAVDEDEIAAATAASIDAATSEAVIEPEPDLAAEPSTVPVLADADAWVAEPDPWESAPTVAEQSAPIVPAALEPEAEDDPAAAWRATAAAAAAAAVVRTTDVEPPTSGADSTTADTAAAAPDAPVGPEVESAIDSPGDHQPTWRPDWLPDVEELEADERTSVLPTDWTPPPVPVQPVDRSDLAPQAAAARTRPASDADRDLDEEGEVATTAEQAVPWLIGFILLLAGMVIVLLALIFAGDASLGGGSGEPTPEPSLAGAMVATPAPSSTVQPSAPPSATAQPSASGSPAPSGAAVGGPQYGPLEMVYQGRSAALAPIYLLHREFTTQPEPAVLAQDPNLDVRRYAWAMDGTLGAGLYADLMVSVEPGVEKRQLADEISALTFGSTTETAYAVRIGQEGGNDIAVVLAVDFASGDATELARITYPRPSSESQSPLRTAQFEDDGGPVRLYWMEDNQLRLWVLGGGLWEIDPGDGAVTEPVRRLPVLWSPDGRNRIAISETNGTTTLTHIDMDGDERGTTTIDGLVSHLRWSPESERIVFTLGRSASGGGVLQDLWLWDLGAEVPTQITATGAAFGPEWMGSRVRWREDPGEA